MTTNEAAERLRFYLTDDPDAIRHLDEALAAERRATVERIEAQIAERGIMALQAILDEEAAR
jgi:hypothetical protein